MMGHGVKKYLHSKPKISSPVFHVSSIPRANCFALSLSRVQRKYYTKDYLCIQTRFTNILSPLNFFFPLDFARPFYPRGFLSRPARRTKRKGTYRRLPILRTYNFLTLNKER